MANEKSLRPFTKGYDPRRNTKGPPKNYHKGRRQNLIRLIRDIATVTNQLTQKEKQLAYQLYKIVENDLALNNISASVDHLYFMESSFGIKIGRSKNVENRLFDIKLQQAPDAEILKVIKYGAEFEKNLHRKFKKFNIRGNNKIGTEWFIKDKALLDFINSINEVKDFHNYFTPKVKTQLAIWY